MSSHNIVLAGGCFWCLDAAYRQVRGVTEVVSGYSGGSTEEPTYYDVINGDTGHAESVSISYDPEIVNEESLLDIFWTIHDPTTPNRQGADVGTQYRSAIFYADEEQRKRAEASREKAQQLWKNPIVTEITPLSVFYPAEDEHQDFFSKHPEKGYCMVVINPKLDKLRHSFADLLG